MRNGTRACRQAAAAVTGPKTAGWGPRAAAGDQRELAVTRRPMSRWLSRQDGGAATACLSEAEWEYAARCWDDEVRSTSVRRSRPIRRTITETTPTARVARGCIWEKTDPVGLFAANGFGLYDVHGNVWEWVEDCWHGSYAGAPTDGRARARVTGGRLRPARSSRRVLELQRTVVPPLGVPQLRNSRPRIPVLRLRVPRLPDAHPVNPYLLTSLPPGSRGEAPGRFLRAGTPDRKHAMNLRAPTRWPGEREWVA